MNYWRYNLVICSLIIALGLFGTTTANAEGSIECSGEVSCAQACEDMENQLNAQNDGETWSCGLADVATQNIAEAPDGTEEVEHTTYWCNCVHWSNTDTDGDGTGDFRPGDDARLFPGKKPGFDIGNPEPPKTDYQKCLDDADKKRNDQFVDCMGMTVGQNQDGYYIPTYGEPPPEGINLKEYTRCASAAKGQYKEEIGKCLRDERRRQGRKDRELQGIKQRELKKKKKK